MRIRIWDIVNPGSGMDKIGSVINIPDPQHCLPAGLRIRIMLGSWIRDLHETEKLEADPH
jgi:hypothetical protein